MLVVACLRGIDNSILNCLKFWRIGLLDQHIFHDQKLQVGAVEHVECIRWRANHGFAAAVERCVEADAVPAQAFELFEERVVAGVGVLCHDLCAGGAVFWTTSGTRGFQCSAMSKVKVM